jgi:hypothetical protein
VLFLDEPTSGLDPESRRRTWDVVRGLLADGTTVMLTTHYLDEAATLADRIAIMHAGRIVRTGTPAEVAAAEPARIAFRLAAGAPRPDVAGRPGVTTVADGRRTVVPYRRPAGHAHRAARLGEPARRPASTTWRRAPGSLEEAFPRRRRRPPRDRRRDGGPRDDHHHAPGHGQQPGRADLARASARRVTALGRAELRLLWRNRRRSSTRSRRRCSRSSSPAPPTRSRAATAGPAR